MADQEERKTTGRFTCAIDPSLTSLDEVARQFEQRGVTVEERMEFIGTLVLRGKPEVVRQAAGAIEGVRSVEPEGTMGTW
ncbi:hypothetical protein FQ775_17910 [Nitratireductor mangrovi]|uniref:Uncharacterized protein n=1 Tax=Nitratireductor mangrovi TaxID=2599600 RepID=A0A5B8L2G3_9HYPH|nr:hypothetical protein [Nitratireductor mangrovi]QDZ02105.1 hypothetical protein FQ775_17910 [Nitratireductor mangrovi]